MYWHPEGLGGLQSLIPLGGSQTSGKMRVKEGTGTMQHIAFIYLSLSSRALFF